MPGQMRVRFERCNGGKTPAKSVLAWLEQGLEITPEQHKAPRKPYAVAAYQHRANVEATITLASPELLSTAITYAQTGRHAINGDWVGVAIEEAVFVPVAQILETASPRSLIRVKTRTPVITINHGFDDRYLSKQRLFDGIKRRWDETEVMSSPEFNSAQNAELLTINGCSKPYYTFGQHRGWDGVLDLKLHGETQRIVNGNALLAYGSMWGIGKGTTVGAGRFEVSAIPRRIRG